MLAYDMPLYRPPSEGRNLIIQATLGCSFNRCAFCSMYRSKTYRVRPLDDVRRDIDAAARVWPAADRVFLADGDALVLPTAHLHAILDHLRARFPALTRVSAYATPANLLKKTPEDLASLKAARLSLVYLGVESGSADVLRRITKGASPQGHATAIDKARAAGLKVSATVILGLAGAEGWEEHATATAALINQAPPTYLSTLQLYLEEERLGPFVEQMTRDGRTFTFQDDAAVLAEQRMFLETLNPPRPVIFRSNHASNALALAGTLPRDKDRLLAEVTAVQGALSGPGWRPSHRRAL
ncbi:radical SAM protein [Roseospira marina]|uniref:Radical SAM protein n=1 Tax=Roseospira marina TaxID=140057 RepID=A0A5M6IEF9_9PROT|nr:radical SAM protein [Roseospira marina]KAA5606634.1 radical SAM protein [Roseospira marina]MBB4313961.1 coproporphyrinogen III oxidase-like Fe-S oxidoreductase [Roseospira marina]MBB5087123.1 coproporphyrinogen III oxidase-like Fe-S oxidoreductase [Roseospira marina]